ncbi:MAG TPA: type I-E CRISPR-associated protein Cas6/Cse3/CasE [Pyrinomonadaceae bacterium]|nr:type I-E CRISPR-associated protein Cas6/Cse3/CasE [Pyrinomonadaceae bacterium]HMP66289.1 type I-E CRISPR-associated protein Cas6/Cse3/CasE [Pyrinomonadaceae bacterium]
MSLYLSRIILNPRSKAVMHDLGSPRELHKTISRCFPPINDKVGSPENGRSTPRSAYNLLHRLDRRYDSFVLYVQSSIEPDWDRLSPGYADRADAKPIDRLYDGIRVGDRLIFRLAANPTKRVGKSDSFSNEKFKDPKKRRRVDIRSETDRIDWLKRKGEECGFRLCEVKLADGVPSVTTSMKPVLSFRHDKARVTLGSVVFDGVLEVTNADAFRKALENGIGTGKAYGFGLMSIAPARQ